jgi:hypothetical protein
MPLAGYSFLPVGLVGLSLSQPLSHPLPCVDETDDGHATSQPGNLTRHIPFLAKLLGTSDCVLPVIFGYCCYILACIGR